MTFGSKLDPQSASYYANLTGFWKGNVTFHNLSDPQTTTDGTTSIPAWHRLADDFVAHANLTNATELDARLGGWNWTRSDKVAISWGDKLLVAPKGRNNVSQDIAMIHVSRGAALILRVRRLKTVVVRARLTSQTPIVPRS